MRSSCRGDHKKSLRHNRTHMAAVRKWLKTVESRSFSLTLLSQPMLHIMEPSGGSEVGVQLNRGSLIISARVSCTRSNFRLPVFTKQEVFWLNIRTCPVLPQRHQHTVITFSQSIRLPVDTAPPLGFSVSQA